MTKRITLRGPVTSAVIETNDENLFAQFMSWLKKYHPTEIIDLDSYPIRTENRLSACRVKARKLNLKVIS